MLITSKVKPWLHGAALAGGPSLAVSVIAPQPITVANIPHVVVDSVPSNASTNIAQVAGTATSTGNGTVDAGTMRVTLASNGTGAINLGFVNGVSTDTNSGTKSAGTLRVVLATDQ